MVTLALADMEMKLNSSFADCDLGSTQARAAFKWGGTIFALFLLLMNRTGRRSHMLTNLLVLYLFASFPTVLFKLVRGQFGCWVAFLAVASNLFFPETFPGRWISDQFSVVLINGDISAIKNVHGDVLKEIKLLNKVNRSNLIRLFGVCNEGNWYLVYEYADNGALSDWIFNQDDSGKFLSWHIEFRLHICIRCSNRLNYLHSFTNPPHVHKDLKTSNILINGDFRDKIMNFALARSAEGREGEFALTRYIAGTKGYMALRYLENDLVCTKLDVYAFGALFLKVITGKEAAAFYGAEYTKSSDILSNVLDNGEDLKHLIESSMLENYPSELAIVVIHLINSCLKKNSTSRPSMEEIVQSLLRILTTTSAWDSSSNISWSQTSTGSFNY